jgi:hypothetical protein
VYVARDDGTARGQIEVFFQDNAGVSRSSGFSMTGHASGSTVSGVLEQESGQLTGRLLYGPYAMTFSAERSDDAADKARTCAFCHFGDQPVYTIRADHPEYVADPPNCLTCHPVD